jgi:hypothetical protein
MPERINQKICFICGAGHSGSTLLGLILGSHPDGFYAGEAAKTRFLGDLSKPERKRVCKICGPPCPIWQDFVVHEPLDLYEQISRKTGKSFIIDSSKNTAWLTTQIEAVSQTEAQPFLIFLQRDGRAVLNSRLRKYPAQGAKALIRDWLEQIELTETLFHHFDGHKIRIHYEELAMTPDVMIEKLCHLLEIPYHPSMRHYYDHDHHPLGGNNGTQSLVAKAQQGRVEQPYLHLPARSQEYYANHPLAIRLDVRWQEELPAEAQKLFEAMAGRINQKFEVAPSP